MSETHLKVFKKGIGKKSEKNNTFNWNGWFQVKITTNTALINKKKHRVCTLKKEGGML